MRTLKISLLIFILSITISAQWYQQNSGVPFNLNSIFFIDSNTGWAVGDEGIILKTSDGGNNWITQAGVTTDNLYSVYFVNGNTGWIVGEDVRIMKSTDGGSNWILQIANPPFPVDLHSVQFLDLNNGWAVGNNYIDSYLIKTTDSGTSWQNNFGFMDEKLFSLCFMNSSLGLLAGSEIFRTSDAGSNWDPVFGSSFLDEFHSIFFIDESNGWFAGKSGAAGVIYKSTNGGLNWNLSLSDSFNTFTSVSFTDANHGWVAGWGGIILYTSNSGTDWSVQVSGITLNLNSIFFINDAAGWAVGDSGIILFTDNGGVTSIGEDIISSFNFSLSQNYPNPFNPVTKIKYSIPSVTLRQVQSDILVTLKVYDLLGREVATLVNEEKPAGEYEVEFNAVSHSGNVQNLPSGIYFYQIKAGQFSETKKMVLLK